MVYTVIPHQHTLAISRDFAAHVGMNARSHTIVQSRGADSAELLGGLRELVQEASASDFFRLDL